jgi:gustatory receptor
MEKLMKTVNIKTVTLPKEKSSSEKYNSHKSFGKILILAQIFGFLPVQGISGPDFRSSHFSWKSIRVMYAVLTILGTTFITVMQLYKISGKSFDLHEANRLFFYCSGIIAGCLFLNLAKNWPALMKAWEKLELSMLSYGWPDGLNRKLNILLTVFMLAALSKIKSPVMTLFISS